MYIYVHRNRHVSLNTVYVGVKFSSQCNIYDMACLYVFLFDPNPLWPRPKKSLEQQVQNLEQEYEVCKDVYMKGDVFGFNDQLHG